MVGLTQPTDPGPTSAPTPPSTGRPPRVPAPLLEALAAEYAAIFAYGRIGAELDDELATAAREAEEAHRTRRDTLVLILTAAGTDPPPAEASYALPFEVTGAADALGLAALVEDRVAAVWRVALRTDDQPARAQALDALIDAAIRATGWRAAAGVTPATVPFPGTV